MGRENAAHSLELTYKSVIYMENANSNNCVPARRKNFSFMSDDALNSAADTGYFDRILKAKSPPTFRYKHRPSTRW